MKKQTFQKTAAAVTAMAAVLTAMTACPVMTASAAENSAFPYAMFAGSDADGALTINALGYCVNGSLATNGTIQTGRPSIGFVRR